MRFLSVWVVSFLLAACSAEANYDIDMSCPAKLTVENHLETISFKCDSAQTKFFIQCSFSTVQRIDGVYYCTTTDKKSVRVTQTVQK